MSDTLLAMLEERMGRAALDRVVAMRAELVAAADDIANREVGKIGSPEGYAMRTALLLATALYVSTPGTLVETGKAGDSGLLRMVRERMFRAAVDRMAAEMESRP